MNYSVCKWFVNSQSAERLIRQGFVFYISNTNAIESIAWCSVQVSVNASDVENKDRVNAIIEKVLGQ